MIISVSPQRRLIAGTVMLLVLVVGALWLSRQEMGQEQQGRIEAIARLGALETQLDNDVLRVVSLRLSHYDDLADEVRLLQSVQRQLSDGLRLIAQDKDSPIGLLSTHYAQQLDQKLDLVEQIKGNAAFLRNEVTYIPFAVSQVAAAGDEVRAGRLLDLAQQALALRTRPSDQVIRSLENGILRLSDGAPPREAAVLMHLRTFLAQQQLLETALEGYVGVNTGRTLDELRGQVLKQQRLEEKHVQWMTRLFGGFAMVLALGLGLAAYMLIRVRTIAAIEHRYLEQVTSERDQRRRMADDLAEKVVQLERTRGELVQSEKMASLGRMVAGFSHEVNTPIGVAVGAASAIEEAVTSIQRMLASEEVSEQELVSCLNTIVEASALTMTNLRRAAELVQSFKRTSVDQSSDALRTFAMGETIRDVLQSLHHMLKRTHIQTLVQCPANLQIHGSPGALGQVLTNLVMNSFIHAFDNGQGQGTLTIKAELEPPHHVRLTFADSGAGMNSNVAKQVFEPFFTTNRKNGGSGLGLYIVYNLVTTVMDGTIACETALGKGTVFTIRIPIRVERPAEADRQKELAS